MKGSPLLGSVWEELDLHQLPQVTSPAQSGLSLTQHLVTYSFRHDCMYEGQRRPTGGGGQEKGHCGPLPVVTI